MAKYKCNDTLDYSYVWHKALYLLLMCYEWVESFGRIEKKTIRIMCGLFEEVAG